jgi:hypothetical protein
MRIVLITVIRRLIAVTLFALTLNVQPVRAQISGDLPDYLTSTFSARFARYYSPYALQAAAAYLDVATLNAARDLGATRDLAAQPIGPDVKAAADYVLRDAGINDSGVAEKVTNYLRAWRYEFGREGYLECFEADPDCLEAIKKDRYVKRIPGGPAFHVWARTGFPQKRGAACREVSIAFRGTDPTKGFWSGLADGIADVDPVSGYVTDTHYRQLRRNIDAIINKITRLPCYRGTTGTQIVSVGHSLGAGLSQLAALANNPKRHQIAKVFAFDPTSVTGASYVKEDIRVENAEHLIIDRIYQSGEFLQPIRRILQQYPKSAAPCVRNVIFQTDRGNALALHSMSPLATGMVKVSHQGLKQDNFQLPPKLPRCEKPRYVEPTTDEDIELAPDGTVMSNRDGSTRVAGANRSRAMNSYAMAGGFAFASPQPTEMNSSVAPNNARRSNAPMGRRAARAQAPVVQVSLEAAWPPG